MTELGVNGRPKHARPSWPLEVLGTHPISSPKILLLRLLQLPISSALKQQRLFSKENSTSAFIFFPFSPHVLISCKAWRQVTACKSTHSQEGSTKLPSIPAELVQVAIKSKSLSLVHLGWQITFNSRKFQCVETQISLPFSMAVPTGGVTWGWGKKDRWISPYSHLQKQFTQFKKKVDEQLGQFQ